MERAVVVTRPDSDAVADAGASAFAEAAKQAVEMEQLRLSLHAMKTIPGIGPILGAVLVAEIGDVRRFSTAEQLGCWAAMTPKHHAPPLPSVRRSRRPVWLSVRCCRLLGDLVPGLTAGRSVGTGNHHAIRRAGQRLGEGYVARLVGLAAQRRQERGQL